MCSDADMELLYRDQKRGCFRTAIYFIFNKRVTQCYSTALLCVFTHVWTTVEFYGTEEKNVALLGYTNNTLLTFGLGPFMGFVDNDKNIKQHYTYP